MKAASAKFLIMFSFFIFTSISIVFPKTLTIRIENPGSLSSLLSQVELDSVTNLTISGNIDARDFRCMRDQMTLLAELNLADARIKAYIGSKGTAYNSDTTYINDEIPITAFTSRYTEGKKTLRKLIFPDTLISIGVSAFSSCPNLSGNLYLPKMLRFIGEGAFSSCVKLNGNLTIGDSVTEIGDGAFRNCTGFNGTLILGKSVKIIRPYAFCATGFTGDLVIPNSVNYLGEYSFGNCTSLDGCLTIGDGLTSFDYGVFYLSGFKKVILGKSITSIYHAVFSTMTNLQTIICPILNPPSIGETTFYGDTATVYVPGSSVAAYKADMYWNQLTIKPINGTDTSYILVDYEHGGGLSENNVALNNGAFVGVRKGETTTFVFLIMPGYEIDRVYFDNIDVTSEIINNQYTTPAILKDAYKILVRFKMSRYTLSIKSAENGIVDLFCKYGDTMTFRFAPASGWKIYSVIYNDEDVTRYLVDSCFTIYGIRGHSMINVSYVQITGVSQITNNQVRIYSKLSDVRIEGVPSGEDVFLYNVNGQMLKTISSNGSPITINLDKSKVYLIKTKTETFKVVL